MLADRIRRFIAKVFGIYPCTIGADASPCNIAQWYSLREMMLVGAREDGFDVRFRVKQVGQLLSFSRIELGCRERDPGDA
ncbi:hypothetical protein BH09GEM1_BH09GEM1_35780 [soil metagenome]